MLVASTGPHLFKCLVSNIETTIISLYQKTVNEQDLNMQLAHQIKIVTVFSCYGNSILYNEIVEIGGYTI